jgi:HSP20 family protein
MKIVPYTKNHEFKPMMSMLNMFDDFFNRVYDEDADNNFKAMALDILEQENEFLILANLPGFKKENVKISVHDNQLLIEARCAEKKEEKTGTVFRSERYGGSFRRNLYLPDNADVAAIQARMEDGVLHLTIPRKAQTPEKQIVIN